MNTNDLWQAVLGELELSLSKVHFTTWFRNTFIFSFTSEEVVVGVPNNFTKTWLEKKYHKEIHKCLVTLTNSNIRRVQYKVETRKPVAQSTIEEPVVENISTPVEEHVATTNQVPVQTSKTANNTQQQTRIEKPLNGKYNFGNFIVGKQNELAHAAAQAVAAHPGGVYNPLFIYGGVGLGKTHLLQAIGNEMRLRNSEVNVLYVTCETFTNEFINAIRSGKGRDFKTRYRNVDLLLVDDIQFITGKEGTQEEFFHTFNELHQNNKQIVISADRPPKAITSLESRLISRFECGMMTDVGSPDFETRVAILGTKCKEKQIAIPQEALHFIADTIHNNVRELEGALNKVIAFHQFKNIPIVLETVQPIIRSLQASPTGKILTPRELIEIVAAHYEIQLDDIIGKSREKRISHPRQVTMYLLREEMKSSYPNIGATIGGRDHTTAMHAYERIAGAIAQDEEILHDVESIRQKLYS